MPIISSILDYSTNCIKILFNKKIDTNPYLNALPNEIKLIIISNLNVPDLMRLRLASKDWQVLAHESLRKKKLHPFTWALLSPNAKFLEMGYGPQKEKILKIPYRSRCGEEVTESVLELRLKDRKITTYDPKMVEKPQKIVERDLWCMSPAWKLPTKEFRREFFERLVSGQPCGLFRMKPGKEASVSPEDDKFVRLRKAKATN